MHTAEMARLVCKDLIHWCLAQQSYKQHLWWHTCPRLFPATTPALLQPLLFFSSSLPSILYGDADRQAHITKTPLSVAHSGLQLCAENAFLTCAVTPSCTSQHSTPSKVWWSGSPIHWSMRMTSGAMRSGTAARPCGRCGCRRKSSTLPLYLAT